MARMPLLVVLFAAHASATTPSCEIRHASELSIEEFTTRYRKGRRPVMIRGATPDWSAHARKLPGFEARFANESFYAGINADAPINPDENHGAFDESSLTLAAFLKGVRDALPCLKEGECKTRQCPAGGTRGIECSTPARYVFNPVLPNTNQSKWLAQNIRYPRYFLDPKRRLDTVHDQGFIDHELFVSIGGTGSGLHAHEHAEGWCVVIQGRKQWYLHEQDFTFPNGSPEEKQDSSSPVRPLECVQEEGDLVFVPEHFYHSVVNHGEVFAISALLPLKDHNDSPLWKKLESLPSVTLDEDVWSNDANYAAGEDAYMAGG